MPTSPVTPPRVFISYSHDSETHKSAVLELAQRLREGGIDAIIDQFVNGSPAQGWPRWMLDELEAARYVLCVCTPTYYRRFRGHEQPGSGKGVNWEGWVISQDLYDANGRNERFIPVLLKDSKPESIPEPLRSATYYRLEPDFEKLYNALLGQAGVKPAPLGAPRLKLQPPESDPSPPSEPPQDAFPPQDEARLLEEVYDRTLEEMDNRLADNPLVLGFLSRVVGELIVGNKFSSGVRRRELVAGGHFEVIKRNLRQFSGTAADLKSLEEVIGGLAVLMISRPWILHQRRVWLRGIAVEYPGLEGVQLLHQGRQVHYLPLIAASLSQGVANLALLFGSGSMDSPNRVEDLPQVTRGLGPDAEREFKLHLIKAVLKPKQGIRENDPKWIEANYKSVLGSLRFAAEKEPAPFFSEDPAIRAWMKQLPEEQRPVYLLLLVPSGSGDVGELVPDHIGFFNHLHSIFTTIQSRLLAP